MKIFDKFKVSAKKENNASNNTILNLNETMTPYQIEVLKELKSIHKSMNRLYRKFDRIELRVENLEKKVNDNQIQHRGRVVK